MPHSAPACDEAQMVWLLPVDWWPLLSDRGRMLRGFSILVLSLLLLARPVMAQQILRDAETEALFNSISAPLEEAAGLRSEEHTSELQSLMRSSYAVFCLK